MDIRDRKGLKRAAGEHLAAANYDPKKLILIHNGVLVALSLVLALLNYLLDQQIGGTGGLSGVGTRTVLETIQTVLTVAQLTAAVFWQISYIYVALRIWRRESIGPESLLEGFRRFGAVLRLRLLTSALYFGLVMLCVYIAATVFTLTPWAKPLLDAYAIGTEEALMVAMEECLLPMYGIVGVFLLVLVVPYYYRLRLADYAVMDRGRVGAMAAVQVSRVLMRRNRLALLKLDLSFWWFYALEILTLLLAYGDMILPMLGIKLPWSADAWYYIFLALCYVCQLALYWWRGNEVQVAYAGFYEALMPKDEEE